MPHLLQLDSAAALKNSRSREITATFADAWRDQGPQYTVTYRDLHRDPLPHLADAVLHWPSHLRPEGAATADPAALAAAEALQDELIGELLTADVLLVGAPLYNYTVPSSLKAWIDHIHVPGRTAPFADSATQPLAGRPAVVVSSRGGQCSTASARWGSGSRYRSRYVTEYSGPRPRQVSAKVAVISLEREFVSEAAESRCSRWGTG